MSSRKLILLALCSLTAITLACAESLKNPASPSTGDATVSLAVTAPVPQSPSNGQRIDVAPATFSADPATLVLGSTVSAATLQYRFQVLKEDGTTLVEESSLRSGPTWTMAAKLDDDTKYTWRVRAENTAGGGPWSTVFAFVSPIGGIVVDPLTDGKTVGQQRGGQFIPGRGWQSLSLTDSIDYDIPPCTDCTLEFDITNIGKKEGEPYLRDLKFISMGDAGSFDDFFSFRDHDWKMHLEQRADGDGTGMKIVWRNGSDGDGEPGDHVNKVDPAVDWRSSETFHFRLAWDHSGFVVEINGEEWFSDGFGGNVYAPPRHRISLGCRSRSDSFIGIIYSNVRVKRNE